MNSSTPTSPLDVPSTRSSKMIRVLAFAILAILVAAAFVFPVYGALQYRAKKAAALNVMRQLGSAADTYTSQNDGLLPRDDSKGADTWAAAAHPDNANSWYNTLPVILSQKSVAQYAANPQAFYSKENILFLPSAKYPEPEKKMARPLFAIAINAKLQGKDNQRAKPARLSQIAHPGRTVLFLEQGLPNEPKAAAQQPKYHGGPKGDWKSFVARYGGSGLITFVDGHVEFIDVKDVVEDLYRFNFPAQPEKIIWRATPEENPNK